MQALLKSSHEAAKAQPRSREGTKIKPDIFLRGFVFSWPIYGLSIYAQCVEHVGAVAGFPVGPPRPLQ
jgi:hypothetical protein